MYIEPRTNIRLLQNVPLDESFDHTIYFANATAQASYFMNKQKYNLTNYSYQRVRRGWARVGINAENLYNCNYMMFQNSSFGSKWFYAFIKSVEYINNEVSEIEFELDPMQTWFFDYEREYCFVERNHTATDNIGEHIEPETVDVGEYVFNNDYHKLVDLTDICVIIAIVDTGSSSIVNPTAISGKTFDRTYSGATYYLYEASDITNINALLDRYKQAPDSVVAMYMCPKRMVLDSGIGIPQDHIIPNNYHSPHYIVNEPAITTNATLDGYKPKNNKMYTYPYNFVHIDDGQGSEIALRYEFFESLMPVVDIVCTFTPPTACVLKPKFYKNSTLGANAIPLGTENMTLTGFPMCSWNTDAYAAWLAQGTAILSATGASAGAVGAMLLGFASLPVAAGIAVASVGHMLMSGYKASIEADIQKGDFNNSNANFAHNYMNFYIGRQSCNKVYARRIDDYFSRFGYALGINAIPQINVRPHWTYVKTIGCTIKGSIPSDDMKKICSIYDKGITFWRNANEVGNYSLDNSPQP